MTSKATERANERARALGFKNAYDRRIKTGLAKGKSRQEARGRHPKEKFFREKRQSTQAPGEKLPTHYHMPQTTQYAGKNRPRRIRKPFDIPLSPEQAEEVVRLEKLGKPKTARAYVLAEVYGSGSDKRFTGSGGTPILAGIDAYHPGWDYDDNQPFDDYDYDDFGDYYDLEPDDETGYGLEE